jgi:hypothetical protein
MRQQRRISLVIPCYNEEAGVALILQHKPDFIDEIIIVDNNSQDGTAAIAKKYGATVIHEIKQGYGWAYQAGLPQATGDIIVIMDGDDSYPVSEIEKLLSTMEEGGFDFVSGCRYPLVNKKSQCRLKRMANGFSSWLIRKLFGIKLTDSQSGMMAFKKDVLDKIKLCDGGMGFSQEIKIKSFLNQRIRCAEAHIPYAPRVGKVKFRTVRDSLKILGLIFRLWRQMRVA